MMEHAEASLHLDEYHDGELSAELSGEVRRHLDACPACRAALEERMALAGSLSRFVRTEPSESFVRNVMARVGAGREPAPARWVMPALTAGFAVALGFIVTGLSNPAEEPVVTAADLLQAGTASGRLQIVESAESPTPDQVLGLFVEEGS